MRPASIVLALLVGPLVAGVPAAAQPKAARSDLRPPSADSLNAISRRGRSLAEHDRAAWLGSGAIAPPSIPQNAVSRLIARHTDGGWEVVSGELSVRSDTFFIAHLATPGMQADRWATSSFDPPQPDTGYFARAARAIETSLAMFRPVARRTYVATVVPAGDGPWWWVYVYPAPTGDGVWPRGGDMRFRVSADGRVITDSRYLHKSITEYSPRSARSASAPLVDRNPIVAGNAPEDTDVFHVVQRRPALPELMTAGRFRYRIDVDGTIRLIGTGTR